MTIKIGSIALDVPTGEPERRGDIVVEDGRMFVDGYDMTPHPGKYKTIEAAVEDMRCMYDLECWQLEWEEA
jgi:hypothetical protein